MSFGQRIFTSSKDVEIPYVLPSSGRSIIAMKGLPYTAKSEVALGIGKWARCQVLSIDDFLYAVSLEKGAPASKEEVERFHHLALYALYKMADHHLNSYSTCVVIKSRLCSLFELDLLMCLAEENFCSKLIILDFHVINSYRYRRRLEDIVKTSMYQEFHSNVMNSRSRSRGLIMKGLEEHSLSHIVGHLVWYKAKSWTDVENAKDDLIDDQSWDDHLLSFIDDNVSYPEFVSRIVVDPFDDFDLIGWTHLFRLPSYFLHVLTHLLNRQYTNKEKYSIDEDEHEDEDVDEDEDEWLKKEIGLDKSEQRCRYQITQFKELRKTLVEEELRSSIYKRRSNKLCITNDDHCVFKYHKKLHPKEINNCMICQERVESCNEAYTCHFCILTLHKPCAETLDLNFLEHIYGLSDNSFFSIYFEALTKLRENIACKSCNEGLALFGGCASCIYKTHLKQRLLPTIINHEGHEHFLSIRLKPDGCMPMYGCHICNFQDYTKRLFMPGEVKHMHGGYEHVMKLTYVHRIDDSVMEPEDDYWCNVCFIDMDPQDWFYYCHDCSYYTTHLYCVGKRSIKEAIRNKKFAIRECKFKMEFDKEMITRRSPLHL